MTAYSPFVEKMDGWIENIFYILCQLYIYIYIYAHTHYHSIHVHVHSCSEIFNHVEVYNIMMLCNVINIKDCYRGIAGNFRVDRQTKKFH